MAYYTKSALKNGRLSACDVVLRLLCVFCIEDNDKNGKSRNYDTIRSLWKHISLEHKSVSPYRKANLRIKTDYLESLVIEGVLQPYGPGGLQE